MIISEKFAAPNSVVLIEDSTGGEIPRSMEGALIAATTSCIAVGSRSDVDGETDFVLGAGCEMDPGVPPLFEGKLSTPSRKIKVRSVVGDTILEAPVANQQTTVRIWTNHQTEPDKVIIGVD